MKNLPKQIYVVQEQDGKDSYLTVHEGIDSMNDGDIVGVYQLQETRKAVVTRALAWKSGAPPKAKR